MMSRNAALALILVPLLGACAAAIPKPVSTAPRAPIATRVPRTDPAPPVTGRRDPQIMRLPGLESVIGAGVPGLVAQFGNPRLDVLEGDARKLQFVGEPCVLDVYLYPLAGQSQPTATYLDARRASDGREVDRAACVAALKRN